MDYQIESITYNRKEVDRGIILGTRKGLYDLSERKYPCKAKFADRNRLLSKRSPQKSNFCVYIPAESLIPGITFKVLDRDYFDRHAKETTYQVIETTEFFSVLSVIREGKPEQRQNKAHQRRFEACKGYKQQAPISKEDAWFVVNPEAWVDDFQASHEIAEITEVAEVTEVTVTTKEGEEMPCNYKEYAPDWKTRIRPEILDRAGNKCESCLVCNGSRHPKTGNLVRLEVHHLDGNPKNNDPDNLRALCDVCHGVWRVSTGKEGAVRGKSGKFEKTKKPVDRLIEPSVTVNKNNGYKSVRNSQKTRHRHGGLLEPVLPVSENEKTRVFIAENKCKKNNKKSKTRHRHGGLLEPDVPVTKSVKKEEKNKKTEKKANLEKFGLVGVPSLSDEKKERKRRKLDRQKYREKEEGYEDERESQKAEKGELSPKRKKRGRPANEPVNLPYHQKVWIGKPLLRYTSAGVVYGEDGDVLTKEEENQIWERILENGSKSERTEASS